MKTDNQQKKKNTHIIEKDFFFFGSNEICTYLNIDLFSFIFIFFTIILCIYNVLRIKIYIQTNFRTKIKIIYILGQKVGTKYENKQKTETEKYSYNKKRTIFFVYKIRT
jgi:hypothetical protein